MRALSFRRFPMPVPTLGQQCATSPTLRTGGMQDIREPMRASIGKSAIANKWDGNGSYLRLQFQHFQHEHDIMTFPSRLLKHNNFLGVPPISMPPSASSFFTHSISPRHPSFAHGPYHPPHQKPTIRPMPGHHGVPPYPPIGPQTRHSAWCWHYEKQWHRNILQHSNLYFPHTSECCPQHGHMQPWW